MNRDYTIQRSEILDTIRKAGWFVGMRGNKLPIGESAGEGMLSIQTGYDISSPHIRLMVRVMPNGVAKR